MKNTEFATSKRNPKQCFDIGIRGGSQPCGIFSTPVRNTLQNMGQMGWLVAPDDGFGVRSRGSRYGASVSRSNFLSRDQRQQLPQLQLAALIANPAGNAEINSPCHNPALLP